MSHEHGAICHILLSAQNDIPAIHPFEGNLSTPFAGEEGVCRLAVSQKAPIPLPSGIKGFSEAHERSVWNLPTFKLLTCTLLPTWSLR